MKDLMKSYDTSDKNRLGPVEQHSLALAQQLVSHFRHVQMIKREA